MTQQITETVIIQGTADNVFELWSDIEMFPSIIKDIKEVNKLDEITSRWVLNGPFGKDLHWTAQITRFDEDKRIAWKTLEGDIKTSGQVTFNQLNEKETEVTVLLQYVPPAGKIGDVMSKVIDKPREKLTEGLRDFKAFAENMPDRIRKNKD